MGGASNARCVKCWQRTMRTWLMEPHRYIFSGCVRVVAKCTSKRLRCCKPLDLSGASIHFFFARSLRLKGRFDFFL